VVSNNGDLVVLNGLPIEILAQPAGDAKYLDESHTFSLTATNGVPPLNYQWSQDWAYVPGAIASGLTRSPLVLSDAGAYRCWVYDETAVGWTWFHNHYYRISPNAMTWQDARDWAVSLGGHLVSLGDQEENDFLQNLLAGTSAWIGYSNFAMDGPWVWSDGQPAGYVNFGAGEPNRCAGIECVAQMRPDGQWNDLAPTALLPAVTESDSLGCVSSPAILVVANGHRLAIAHQPHGGRISEGASYTFVVDTIEGVGAITYQWTFNDAPISNATLAQYTVNPAVLEDEGSYECVVSDDYSTLMSSPAWLAIGEGGLPVTGLAGLGVLIAVLALAGVRRRRKRVL
jgi:hypothetical protein